MNPVLGSCIADAHIIGQTFFATLAGIRAPTFPAGSLPAAIVSELFESHFTAWIGCIVIGFILSKIAQMRRQRALAQTALTLVLLTTAWMLAAYLVDTPAERLLFAHKRLLAAAQRKDMGGIQSVLDEKFAFGPLDRAGLVKEVEASLKTFTIKSNMIRSYEAQLGDRQARSAISVVSQLDGTAAGTYLTQWQLVWQDYGADWQLERIDGWKLNNQPMPAEDGFPKAP